jgi:predicted dinucleotide-binding enzyme
MRITTVGRGTVGGGLAGRWRNAGHEVTELGPDGGDASDADAVLVAVPSGAIDDALSRVTGLEGRSSSTRRTISTVLMNTVRSADGTSPSRRSRTR